MYNNIEDSIELDTTAIEGVLDKWEEHLDYVLRGAWRAGYSYVHVYHPKISSGAFRFPITRTTNTKKPLSSPMDYYYSYTYIIDDERMREIKSKYL